MAGQARQRRIESEIQRSLAELISREVRDPRVGSITITAVEVTSDMSLARVLFVPFGAGRELEPIEQGLNRAAGFLRGELGRRLSLRHAPRLEFRFDQSIERAAELTGLIDQAVRADQDRARIDDADYDHDPKRNPAAR
jgi:ribosome-binding factor A